MLKVVVKFNKSMSILLTFIVFVVVMRLVLDYLAPKLPSPIGMIITIVVALLGILWLLGLVFPTFLKL